MRPKLLITLLFLGFSFLSFGQLNPSLFNLDIIPDSSSGRPRGAYTCGDTISANFNLNITGIFGYLVCETGLKVKIFGQNISFRDSVNAGLNVTSVPDDLDSLFSISFSTKDTLVLTQTEILSLSFGNPFLRNITVKLRIPITSKLSDTIRINAKIDIPSFQCPDNNPLDNSVQTSAVVFCNQALAISVTQLQAEWIDKRRSKITWKVLDQEKVSRFQIERKSDFHNDWIKIAELPVSLGNKVNAYHYIDIHDSPADLIYYRIKIIETNGKSNYTRIEKIESNSHLVRLSGYPNPTSGEFTLNLKSFEEESTTLEIIDVLGRKVLIENIEINEGLTTKKMNLTSLKPGIYYIRPTGRLKQNQMTLIKT